MSEETLSEREDRLQKSEERLQKQHQRVMESRNNPPQPGNSGAGKGLSSILSFFGAHKLEVILIAIGLLFLSVIVALNRNKSTSSNPGNQQGNLSTAPDAGTAYALTQLTDQLNTITNLLNQQSSNKPTLPNPIPALPAPPPAAPAPSPSNPPFTARPILEGTIPQDTTQYVTVTPWPSAFGSLSGIAQAEGISLSRVESLNPQLYNQHPGSGWDLIYPGQRVRIS